MRTTIKITFLIATVLFVGAGVAWQHSQHLIHQYHWIVLEQPIRLEKGFSVSRPFTVDVAAKYSVEVECHRTVPFDTLDQALKKLAAQYAVTSGTDRIAFGDTSLFMGSGSTDYSISRYIVTFDAVPDVPYELALRITAGLPEVASTHPTVKVSIDPLVFKRAYVSASLSAYLALGLAVTGLLCTMGGWMVARLKPRDGPSGKVHEVSSPISGRPH